LRETANLRPSPNHSAFAFCPISVHPLFLRPKKVLPLSGLSNLQTYKPDPILSRTSPMPTYRRPSASSAA